MKIQQFAKERERKDDDVNDIITHKETQSFRNIFNENNFIFVKRNKLCSSCSSFNLNGKK